MIKKKTKKKKKYISKVPSKNNLRIEESCINFYRLSNRTNPNPFNNPYVSWPINGLIFVYNDSSNIAVSKKKKKNVT